MTTCENYNETIIEMSKIIEAKLLECEPLARHILIEDGLKLHDAIEEYALQLNDQAEKDGVTMICSTDINDADVDWLLNDVATKIQDAAGSYAGKGWIGDTTFAVTSKRYALPADHEQSQDVLYLALFGDELVKGDEEMHETVDEALAFFKMCDMSDDEYNHPSRYNWLTVDDLRIKLEVVFEQEISRAKEEIGDEDGTEYRPDEVDSTDGMYAPVMLEVVWDDGDVEHYAFFDTFWWDVMKHAATNLLNQHNKVHVYNGGHEGKHMVSFGRAGTLMVVEGGIWWGTEDQKFGFIYPSVNDFMTLNRIEVDKIHQKKEGSA